MYGAAQAKESGYEVPRARKVKKVGFFKRWLLKAMKDAVESDRRESQLAARDEPMTKATLQIGPASIDQPERAIQFTVYTANGGRIVETRRYDRKTDRSSNGLYIITGDQDFGREIDKIITMEALK